jgi:hypothetical protein
MQRSVRIRRPVQLSFCITRSVCSTALVGKVRRATERSQAEVSRGSDVLDRCGLQMQAASANDHPAARTVPASAAASTEANRQSTSRASRGRSPRFTHSGSRMECHRAFLGSNRDPSVVRRREPSAPSRAGSPSSRSND